MFGVTIDHFFFSSEETCLEITDDFKWKWCMKTTSLNKNMLMILPREGGV